MKYSAGIAALISFKDLWIMMSVTFVSKTKADSPRHGGVRGKRIFVIFLDFSAGTHVREKRLKQGVRVNNPQSARGGR
jgi:hypothetical protein